MISKLRILILEDDQNDADLLNRELNKSGLSFTSETVQTHEKFEYALEHFAPDLIISDYSLPSFDAVTAFDIKQNKSPHIPFIIVSGIIGEENAVELIKKGVTDYAPKDKLFTLPQKINRALKQTEERKEKEIIAEKLKIQAAALIVANDDLLRLNQHLEKRVSERTRELEKLNHELKGISLSKDKFLSVISHDLRNPLTALLLASDMLNYQIEDEIFKVVQPFAKIINLSSHNILDQLNELVDWAKMQQEKTILNAERLHLASTINQSFELIKINATQKNIVLENKVPDDIYVKADALMLRSILQNLVTNAIKFSAEGGLVSVMAGLKDNMMEIGIIDRGIGMDANFSANLFQEFNTATATGTNNEKGSGIGLKLVKDFVTQNCGTLRVESEIKKGTSILFTLPPA